MPKKIIRVWEMDTDDDTSEPLSDFIAQLIDIRDREAEFGALTFRTEKDWGYYDDPTTFSVWIEREETDEECRVREEKAVADAEASRAAAAERVAAFERREYARLKARFEGKA